MLVYKASERDILAPHPYSYTKGWHSQRYALSLVQIIFSFHSLYHL